MIHLFKDLNLMYITEIPLVNKAGKDYTGYRINYVETKLSKKIIEF